MNGEELAELIRLLELARQHSQDIPASESGSEAGKS
jgi:hypothetical protein